VAQQLTVDVRDLNEAPVGLTLDPARALEAQPAGTLVGGLLAADPDASDSFTYELAPGEGDEGNALFEVSGADLLTAAALDADAAGLHTVRIRARDAGRLSCECVLTVEVVHVTARGEADADRDGIPDAWEQFYVADSTNMPAGVDGDLDGLDNLSEWIADTNPQRDWQYFTAELADAQDGHPVIRWGSSAGRVYDVDWAPDLVTPFSGLVASLPATPPQNEHTDFGHTTADAGFYRVTVRLAP
jgi:hypothetical protein